MAYIHYLHFTTYNSFSHANWVTISTRLKWCFPKIVPKDIPISSLILKEEDSLEMPKDEVRFFIDLKFWPNNLCENVHDVSLKDKTSVEDDMIIDLFEVFKEEVQHNLNLSIEANSMIEFVQQNQVEEIPAMINIIMSIHIEDKKVIIEKDLAAKIKLICENIEQNLAKDLRHLKVICSYKTSSSWRVTNMHKKKMKKKDWAWRILNFKHDSWARLQVQALRNIDTLLQVLSSR